MVVGGVDTARFSDRLPYSVGALLSSREFDQTNAPPFPEGVFERSATIVSPGGEADEHDRLLSFRIPFRFSNSANEKLRSFFHAVYRRNVFTGSTDGNS